jgi:hypothetical protein
VKPAVIFKAVPGYCLPPYRRSQYNAWGSVEWAKVHCMGGSMADCLLMGGFVVDNFTLFWDLKIESRVSRIK